MKKTLTTLLLLMLSSLLCFGQLADGASNLQSELEDFAGPASIAGLILAMIIGYFSDDGGLGKRIAYACGFISVAMGAATMAGLFGA